MAYIGNSPGVASQRVTSTFTATAGQTTFTPISGYTLGYCDVYYNGVKLVDGDDYTASNGVTVVLTNAAAVGDSVEIVTHFPRGLSDGYTQSEANARYAQRSNNLSDLSSASTARTNLGLGTAATQNTGVFLQTANNLSDVTASTARSNLGIGNVENKSSATIRGELTSGNVTGALGYTPLSPTVGDTTASITTQADYSNPLIIQRSSNSGKGAVILRGSDSIGVAIEFGRSNVSSHWGTYFDFLVHNDDVAGGTTAISKKVRIGADGLTVVSSNNTMLNVQGSTQTNLQLETQQANAMNWRFTNEGNANRLRLIGTNGATTVFPFYVLAGGQVQMPAQPAWQLLPNAGSNETTSSGRHTVGWANYPGGYATALRGGVSLGASTGATLLGGQSSGRLYVPCGGVYKIWTTIRFENTPGTGNIYLHVNGSQIMRQHVEAWGLMPYAHGFLSAVILLAANDYIEISVERSGGTVSGYNDTVNWFSGHLIG